MLGYTIHFCEKKIGELRLFIITPCLGNLISNIIFPT